MKATGAEIKEFYASPWPDEAYVDDYELCIDDIGASEEYDLSLFGVIVHRDCEVVSFASAFQRWKKNGDTDTLVIRIPRARRDEIAAALKRFGVKV